MNRVLLFASLVLAILSALLFFLGEAGGHLSLAGAFASYVAAQLA